MPAWAVPAVTLLPRLRSQGSYGLVVPRDKLCRRPVRVSALQGCQGGCGGPSAARPCLPLGAAACCAAARPAGSRASGGIMGGLLRPW